ncbi:MAG: DUF3791 domain-containing protein [Cardiobacteriaceae bacterium]|nr:DUF3791 domain-containing protein [Cardiobacteriaceae bacterium]
MTKLSFVSFCINYYSEFINKPANEIYELFQKTGLLQMLRDDYEDLHGMSMEYMMQFCDEYLGNHNYDCVSRNNARNSLSANPQSRAGA